MDRREGTSLEGTPSINTSFPTANIPFRTSSDSTSRTLLEADISIDQALVVDTSLTTSPRGHIGVPSVVPQADQPDGALLAQPPSTPAMTLTPGPKRGRGTPPGTSGKQQLASFGGLSSRTAETGFTPHVIIIAQGEDICTKLISFSQQEHRSIYVLSANGGISTVILREPSTSGGTVKYEGNFEIVCLSGSFLLDDSGESQGTTGGLSVSFASPDGCVIGGAVGNVLVAASPIQVIVGSFFDSNSKANKKAVGSVETVQTSDHQPWCPADALPNQNLTSTSSIGKCPCSKLMDLLTSDYDTDNTEF